MLKVEVKYDIIFKDILEVVRMIGMSQIRKRLIYGILIGAAIGIIGIAITLIWAINVVNSYKEGTNKEYVAKYTTEVVMLNRDVIQGETITDNMLYTEGSVSSQYISGLMMAALLLEGTLNIELSNPKETPYLTMTQKWLEHVGAKVDISKDFKHISVAGPVEIKAFDVAVPSDWEAVAFPLIAALM